MKNLLRTTAIGLLLGISTYAVQAQNYRTIGVYQQAHDGTEFVPNGDSSYFFFSGSNSWIPVYNEDISTAFRNAFVHSLIDNYEVEEYPAKKSLNTYSTIDSAHAFGASGSGYGDLKARTIITRQSNGDMEILGRGISGGSWVNTFRLNYEHNSSGKITNYIRQNWSGGAWVNFEKELSEYTDGKLTKWTTQKWTGGAWQTQNQYLYEYSGNDCNVIIHKTLSGGSMVNNARIMITYEGGKNITEVRSTWDGAAWVDNAKFTHTYTASSGKLKTAIRQNKVGGAWVDKERHTYTYDSGKPANYLKEEHDGTLWNNVRKLEYNYSEAGRLKEIVVKNWVPADSDWKNVLKFVNNYDENGNLLNFSFINWNAGGYWENVAGNLKYNFVHKKYSGTGILNPELVGDFKIFPNPANSVLNVHIQWQTPQNGQLSIYDIQGKHINSTTFNTAEKVEQEMDISTLPTGSYFLQISNENGHRVEMFQVVK